MTLIKAAFVSSLLAVSGMAHAQQATQADAAPTEPQSEQPAPPVEVKETNGDWQIRCQTTPTGETCVMVQVLKNNNGAPIAEIRVQKLPENLEGVAGVTVVTPLGTLLTQSLAMQIDDQDPRGYPFVVCEPIGCFSRFALTNGDIDAIKNAVSTRFRIIAVANPSQPILLNLSLTGFSASWTTLNEVEVAQ